MPITHIGKQKTERALAMDILNIVVSPTWREFLMELITTNQIDPWDVDVAAVADAYLGKVRELQALDLRIPANVILASALLLHFKADTLRLDMEPDNPVVVEEEVIPLVNEDVPDLVFRPNIAKSRRVTLEELMNAVDSVMAVGKIRPRMRSAPVELSVELPKEDMHEMIRRFYEGVCQKKDAEGIIAFTDMLPSRTPDEFARNIIPLLHLVQDGKLAAWQDQLFGEIFIKYLSEAEQVDALTMEVSAAVVGAVQAKAA